MIEDALAPLGGEFGPNVAWNITAERQDRHDDLIGAAVVEHRVPGMPLHLDRGTEREVLQALALGFTSVMFDGDVLSSEENICVTKRLREAAHSVGASMEAEVGEVPKPDGKEFDEAAIDLTQPEEAAQFAETTGIDTLAVALGSVHGLKTKQISLDLECLSAIRKCVSIPLVLHGSSGVSDNDIKQGIALGLCKVNVATQLNRAFTEAIRNVLDRDNELVDPRKYLTPGRSAQMEIVRERIRFFEASGKARQTQL